MLHVIKNTFIIFDDFMAYTSQLQPHMYQMLAIASLFNAVLRAVHRQRLDHPYQRGIRSSLSWPRKSA